MAKLLILNGPNFNLLGVGALFIEVHLFNVFAHKSFRHHSYQFGMAVGVISGLHGTGYELALQAAGVYLLRC